MSEISNESQNKKARLGRGLGSLLGENSTMRSIPAASIPPVQSSVVAPVVQATASTPSPVVSKPAHAAQSMPPAVPAEEVSPQNRIWKVAIDKLQPSSVQPRRHFEKAKLEELAQSIKTSGILQPILTRRRSDGKFEIIAGERRWRAAQLAGLHELPVLVREFDELTALEVAIIENIQREDLNPIEEAEAYFRLSAEFRLTQAQVADKVGKDRATVANSIRLLQLEPSVKELLGVGKISTGHAKVLLTVPGPEAQRKLAERVISENLTVRQLEKAIRALNKPEEESSELPQITSTLVQNLSDEVQRALGTKVSIDYANGKGKILIHFYSDDELTSITDKMRSRK